MAKSILSLAGHRPRRCSIAAGYLTPPKAAAANAGTLFLPFHASIAHHPDLRAALRWAMLNLTFMSEQ